MDMKNKIKQLVDSKGITVYRFRQEVGIAQRTAYDLYNDPTKIPNTAVLQKICNTYRVQPGEILEMIFD